MIDNDLHEYFKNNYCVDVDTGRWFTKASSTSQRKKYVTADQIYAEYCKIRAAYGKSPESSLSDLEDHMTRATPDKPQVKIYFPQATLAVNWIYGQLLTPNSPFDISSRFDMINFKDGDESVATTDKVVTGWLECRAAELGKSKLFKVGIIKAGWDQLKLLMHTKCIKMLKDSIEYNPVYEQNINEFTKAIYDYLQIKEDYEIFNMLFKHWCWTLKRHIWNRPVTWQIWINFYGAQGIGKTEMIRRMCKFMRDFFAEANLNSFNDLEKQYKLFTDSYILYFDELNKGDNKDAAIEMTLNQNAVDSIKDLMTKDIITVRQYQTQDQGKFKNVFTPISAANNHLYDIVYDGEAMRRWFDFTCQRETIPASYDEINNILATFQEALRGVDENNEDGYWDQHSEIGKKIKQIQKTYVPTNTSTNRWIDYCFVKPDLEHNKDNMFTANTYCIYKLYCKAVGKYSASMDKVIAIIKRVWPDCADEDGNVYITVGKRVGEFGEIIDMADTLGANTAVDEQKLSPDEIIFIQNTNTMPEEKTSPECDYTPSKKVKYMSINDFD